jgi:ATP synthase protein I
MPSNDARTLAQAAVPTAAVGAIAAAVSAVVAGGKGAVGAVVAAVIVILFMGLGLYALQRTAASLPHLFQAMGLMLYTAQILLLFVFVAAFKNTTLFNPKAFALTLVVATLAWIGAQTRAHMKAKILYVQPDATPTPAGDRPETTGHPS